ncbi:MAG: DUF2911 domain-containing protein [Gemmatimonadaceae bacterium]|nr:DUF2911 domain-containing protein [Gemmatimonadaceae bacterium]
MTHFSLSSGIALVMFASATIGAQAVLRPGPSGRATSQVTLAYPRPATPVPAAAPAPAPATPGTAMGGMAGMTTPGAAVAPVAKPLTIRVDYGQPHLRGRLMHTDSLLPFDKPWRLGSNNSTTLTSDVDLMLGSAPLAKGTYVLYAIPSRTSWKLIVQRSAGQSAMTYADSNDVVRIDLRHTRLAEPLESLTMWLVPVLDSSPARGELRFAWGTDQLSVPWSVR